MVNMTRLFGAFRRRYVQHRPKERGLGVSIGQRFFEGPGWENLWIVERVLQSRGDKAGHIVLRHARFGTERRLVAHSTLLNSGRYLPLSETGGQFVEAYDAVGTQGAHVH